MAAERLPQQDLAATLVVEALDRVAIQRVRDRVLRRALEHAGLDAVPSRIEDLTFFVSGPLYEQAVLTLGADFADELLLEMSAALDRAWDHARSQVEPTSATRQISEAPDTEPSAGRPHQSSIRRARSLGPSDSDAPLSSDHPLADALRAVARDTLPSEKSDSMPPQVPSSRRRHTMPYLQAVFTPPAPAQRLMVIDADDDTRRSLGIHFSNLGYAVVCAQSIETAHALYARLRPRLVILDVETVAPDFEPLRSAFDSMFGDDVPQIVLLSDGEARELPEQVAFVLHRPWSEDALDVAVETLMPLESN